MTVPFRTYAALGVTLGLFAAGYLLAPAAGSSTTLPGQSMAKAAPAIAAPAAPAKPVPALIASRPPVPLVTQPRTIFYTPPVQTADKPPVADKSGTTPEKPKVAALTPDQPTDTPTGDGAVAKRAIEVDGYKNPRNLVKGPDGMWHGRAMRGRTEVAVRVDASGNVSAE